MRIVFAGAGAVGSTALWFCRNLDGDIVVIDFDRVESRNLLAQVFTRQAIGKKKPKPPSSSSRTITERILKRLECGL